MKKKIKNYFIFSLFYIGCVWVGSLFIWLIWGKMQFLIIMCFLICGLCTLFYLLFVFCDILSYLKLKKDD